MSSEKSPYKEVGLTGRSVSSRKRRGHRSADTGLFSEGKSMTLGHYYTPVVSSMRLDASRQIPLSDTSPCRRCGQPRFATVGEKCRGRRP